MTAKKPSFYRIKLTPKDQTPHGVTLIATDGSPFAALPPSDEVHANARRLAACWNHCRGVTTQFLEQNPHQTEDLCKEQANLHQKWKKGRQALANLNRAHERAKKERDEFRQDAGLFRYLVQQLLTANLIPGCATTQDYRAMLLEEMAAQNTTTTEAQA